MKIVLSAVALLLALLLFVMHAPAAQTAQLNRDLLWAAVRTCVAAKRTVGLSLPCRSVDLGDEDRPGTALLRVPGAATHHVLMPVDDISGLEAPELQGPAGAAIFNAAWSARADALASSPRARSLSNIGLAINAPLSRSQDHLHIHLDCVRSDVLAAVRGAEATETWAWLAPSLLRRRYIVRRVPAERVASFNPFAALVEFLPQARLIAQSSLAAIPGDGGEVYVLADIRPQSWAEGLLDHSCTR